MKKKLLALVATVCMLFSLVGCKSEGLALLKEFNEVETWTAAEQTGSMAFEMAFGKNAKGKLTLDYTAYTVTDKLQMEMLITPKTLVMDDVTIDLTQGLYKISPVKVYMDGVKMYISTSYIKELLTIAGATSEDIKAIGLDLGKEYIGMDLTDYYKEMGMDITKVVEDSKELSKDFYAQLAKEDMDCTIVQEGRKYTIELTANQIVTAASKMLAKSFELQKDTLVAEYKAMGLSDEEIKAVMDEMAKMTSEENLAQVKEMMKDSTGKMVFTYEQGKQVSEYAFNIVANIEGEKIEFKLNMNDTAVRTVAKEIKMPTSTTLYTMEELLKVEETPVTTEATVVEVEPEVEVEPVA